MALRLLCVDPDSDWLLAAKDFFTQRGYAIDTVENGKDAQLMISKSFQKGQQEYFQVIINLEVQNYSGPQVMKFLRLRFPKLDTTVILSSRRMIDEGVLTEWQLNRLGAIDALIRPFPLEDLLSLVEGAQSVDQLMKNMPDNEGQSDVEEVDANSDSYFEVPMVDFIPNRKVLFDVFIKINDKKFLKILHAGDSFAQDRITHYRENKGVSSLYFHKRDRRKYIRFCNLLANRLIKKHASDKTQVKGKVLKIVAQNFVDEVDLTGVKPQILEQGKELCNNIFNMIQSDKQLFKVVSNLNDFDPTSFSHSYMVCLFTSMIVNQFKWKTPQSLETAGIAALLHDIGKTKLPATILEKNPREMNEEELAEYKKHPIYSTQLLEENRLITTSIKQVIRQHHEYSDGSGFPDGLRDDKLLTISKIISLANFFTDYIADKELSPRVALSEICKDPLIVKKFNDKVLENLKNAFKDPETLSKDTGLSRNSKLVKTKIF